MSFPNEYTPEFVKAVKSVESEFRRDISVVVGLALIHHVYALWEKKPKGNFRGFFDEALNEYQIDLADREVYTKLIGRYFNPRAVRAKKKARTEREPEEPFEFLDLIGIPNQHTVVLADHTGNPVKFVSPEGLETVSFKDVTIAGDVPHWLFGKNEVLMRKKALEIMKRFYEKQ